MWWASQHGSIRGDGIKADHCSTPSTIYLLMVQYLLTPTITKQITIHRIVVDFNDMDICQANSVL
jgi:hypothetical protein